MKTPVPYFRAEATIAAALARRTPDMVPQVLAVEPAEGWLLMGDVGDRILGKLPESTWADGLRQIPALQRAWIGHTDELAAAGAQVRPLSALAEALPGFLDREHLGDRLEATVRSRWIEGLPRLVDMCHRLDALGLPDTVVHGDMHPWNIAMKDGGLRVFDWSDGAVGHPFVDLPPFLGRAKDAAVPPMLRAAYLDGWSDFLPRDRLETAADLAPTVGALYQVETYLRLNPQIDPHDQHAFKNADARWLGHALNALEAGPAGSSIA
jgi:Ser/Thr protein kinase RdoA (MazF antagonist)